MNVTFTIETKINSPTYSVGGLADRMKGLCTSYWIAVILKAQRLVVHWEKPERLSNYYALSLKSKLGPSVLFADYIDTYDYWLAFIKDHNDESLFSSDKFELTLQKLAFCGAQNIVMNCGFDYTNRLSKMLDERSICILERSWSSHGLPNNLWSIDRAMIYYFFNEILLFNPCSGNSKADVCEIMDSLVANKAPTGDIYGLQIRDGAADIPAHGPKVINLFLGSHKLLKDRLSKLGINTCSAYFVTSDNQIVER